MPHLPAVKATMVVHGRRVTSNICKELREAIHGTRLAEHIKTRNQWSTSTFNLVDWDACKIAMKKQRNESKTHLIKCAHDWLPVGHQQQHLCKDTDPTCPTCKEPGLHEKTSHAIRCHKQKTLCDKCLQAIQTNLAQIQTNNLTKMTMQKGIMNWTLRPHGTLQLPRHCHNHKLMNTLAEAVTEPNKQVGTTS